MKNRKKMILTAAALCAMALFAGCTTASAVSLEEAQNIALNTAGVADAIFTERHLDPDDGVYEISFTADGVEYEFEVDAQTGAVREVDRDREGRRPAGTAPVETQPAASTPATGSTRITLAEAKAIAYAHAGVSEADAYDRSSERDDGIYEIDFEYGGYDYEYDISPTGEILNVEKEPDRDGRPVSAPAETVPAETQPAASTPATGATRITLAEAKAIAYAHAGVSEADAYDRSSERDDGIYEIDFEYGGYDYEYDISPTGEILNVEKEPDRDGRPVSAPAETVPAETGVATTDRITADEARAIAYAHAGVRETDARDRDCEWDDGRWEVSFEAAGFEYDYDIAADGTILHVEKEIDG